MNREKSMAKIVGKFINNLSREIETTKPSKFRNRSRDNSIPTKKRSYEVMKIIEKPNAHAMFKLIGREGRKSDYGIFKGE